MAREQGWLRFGGIEHELDFVRPRLSPVEHREQFQSASPDAIRNDIRSACYDQFTSSRDSTRSTDVWLCSQEFRGIQNSPSDASGAPRTIFCNIVAKSNQMVDSSPRRSDNRHRGALPSEGLPHESSHLATRSWLNTFRVSTSAIPARISRLCHSSVSTFAVIASAARNDFERFDRRESGSSRLMLRRRYPECLPTQTGNFTLGLASPVFGAH